MEQMYTVSWYDSNGELVECSFSNREVADYFYNYISSRDQIQDSQVSITRRYANDKS